MKSGAKFAAVLIWLRLGFAVGSYGHEFRIRLWVEADVGMGMAAPVELSIGSRKLWGVLDFRTALTVVVDRSCGRLPPNRRCAAYCREDHFAAMFCHPLCRQQHQNDFRMVCGNVNSNYYDSATSPTFSDLNGTDVVQKYEDSGQMRPMWGLWGKERIGFPGWFKAPNVSECQFVRAIMFDNRLADFMHLGLKPKARDGTPSLIPQLHQLGAIPHAAITMTRSRVDWFRSAKSIHDVFLRMHTVTIGGLDSAFCYDWALTEAMENSWDFWITDVVLMGVEIPGKFLARLNLTHPHFLVHQSVANQFLASNLLHDANVLSYGIYCDIPVTLSFKVNQTLVQFEHTDLTFQPLCKPEKRTVYMTMLAKAPEARYEEDEAWEFGYLLHEKYCAGFDYSLGMAAWGKRRKIFKDRFY